MIELSKEPTEIFDLNNSEKTFDYNHFYNFILFNKYDGKIIGVSNKFIYNNKISNAICKKFLTFKYNNFIHKLKNYKIEFDIKTNKHKIIDKKDKIVFNVDNHLVDLDFIYIKNLKSVKDKFDIRILQFLDSNYVQIEANNIMIKNFINLQNTKVKSLSMYFCDKNDLDFLYGKIEINLLELIKYGKILIDASHIRKNINPLNIKIFTTKILENYQTYIIDSYYEIEKIDQQEYNIQAAKKDLPISKADILFELDHVHNTIYVEKTKNFQKLDLVDKFLKFYIMDDYMDFFDSSIVIDAEKLNKHSKIKIKLKKDIKNKKIIHGYNYLKVSYVNTNNGI